MKHGSESRELIDGAPGQRHAGTSRSPYDNSICSLWKLSSFLIRVPSVFHPWLRNPFLTLRRLLDFPLELPVGADALPRNNVRLFPPRVNKGSWALTGYEFPQHCERTTVRSRRKKEEVIARSFLRYLAGPFRHSVFHPPSAIRHSPSAIRHPPFRTPHSAFQNPKSKVQNFHWGGARRCRTPRLG